MDIAPLCIFIPSKHGIDSCGELIVVRLIDTTSVYPEVVQVVMLCLFAAKFQFLEARLVIASAIDNVLVRDFVIVSLSPGVRENGIPQWNLVGLAQPSAVQASLYRLHFGNPEISPVAYIFSPTGFTSATPKSALQAFIFIIST
jgi:hypothetical protein